MTNLGVYYAPEHTWPEDIDYIRKLQPPVLRLFEPDVQMIADIHAIIPNAIICPRTWAIDDGSDEAHPSKQVNRINADPVATANDHAQQYRGQLDQWKQQATQRGLTLPADDHIYFNCANEPNQGGELDKIATYAVAFLNRCTELGLRATAPCLGVGWPDNSGPDTPVNWQPYINAGLEQAIKRGNHWLELHEYFDKSGPQLNWTWWAGRHLQCPLDVPILLGEIGMDNYVNAAWSKQPEDKRGNRGWQGNATPDQYADMIQWHISHSDTRVVAGLVFITDIRNREWESFNTRGAHGALLARKDAMVPQTKPKFTITLPVIKVPDPAPAQPDPSGPTATPNVPAGANVRIGASTLFDIIGAVPNGQPMTVTGKADGEVGTRYQVDSPFGPGWVFSGVVSATNVDNVPTVTPPAQPETPAPDDDWPRILEWLHKQEGGFQDFDWDAGNWTGCKVGAGEKKGTNFGISACAYPNLDIPNLTQAQADNIFYHDFYLALGIDKQTRPLNLLMMNAAVNFPKTNAIVWLRQSGGDPMLFYALMLRGYRHSEAWPQAGDAWVDRMIDLAQEVKS